MASAPFLDELRGVGFRGLSSLIAMTFCFAFAGCAQRFAILRGTDFPNPPHEKLRLAIVNLEDSTGLYPKLGVRFEEEVRNLLNQDELDLIDNLDFIGTEPPRYLKTKNRAIFEPVVMSSNSAGFPEGPPSDLILSGSVQEIYFGDARFDLGAFAGLGFLGASLADGKRTARVAVRMKVSTAVGRKTIFERTIVGSRTGRDLERVSALDAATRDAAVWSVSYLLHTKPF